MCPTRERCFGSAPLTMTRQHLAPAAHAAARAASALALSLIAKQNTVQGASDREQNTVQGASDREQNTETINGSARPHRMRAKTDRQRQTDTHTHTRAQSAIICCVMERAASLTCLCLFCLPLMLLFNQVLGATQDVQARAVLCKRQQMRCTNGETERVCDCGCVCVRVRVLSLVSVAVTTNRCAAKAIPCSKANHLANGKSEKAPVFTPTAAEAARARRGAAA